MTIDRDLIYDVGLHTGQDTAFYLAKGFRVVAIEAHPELAESARHRFAAELADGRLKILECAVGPREGPLTFYVNERTSVWGTTSRAFVERNAQRGAPSTAITVQARPLHDILEEHGIPYYLKIDVEGADIHCLESLHRIPERPPYLSFECSHTDFEQLVSEMSHVWLLGYRRFYIANQAAHRRLKCPNPAAEGHFVEATFDSHSSGLFGAEVPGPWLSIEQAMSRMRWIVREQRLFGNEGVFGRQVVGNARRIGNLYRGIRHKLLRTPIGWYDIHAKLF
jgi:FkbM family methyltransferase